MIFFFALIFGSGVLFGSGLKEIEHRGDVCAMHGGILSAETYDGGSLTCSDLTRFEVYGPKYGQTPTLYDFSRGPAKRYEVIYNLSLSDFPDVNTEWVNVPEDFKRFKSLYYFSLEESCEGSIARQVHEDGLVFVFTSDGDCDGDSSSGIVYRNSEIIGLINDGDIRQIKLEDIKTVEYREE